MFRWWFWRCLLHGERRDLWFLAFAPPQQWGRRRDRWFTSYRDEAVRDRRFVKCVVGRGPLDLETCCLRARLAARPRRFQALEGGAAPGGAGAKRLRRGDLGVHGLFVLLCSQPAPGLPPPDGLPPQRGRGSHECTRMLAAWRPGYSGRYSRSTFGARRSMQRWMARGTEARPSQYCERSRYACESDARSARAASRRRRRHRRDPTSGETGMKLLIAS